MTVLTKVTTYNWIEDGLKSAATIIMITGAGGGLGAILKATEVGDNLGNMLASYNLGIFLPFLILEAFKTAQGSSTVALVATSALVALCANPWVLTALWAGCSLSWPSVPAR